MGAGAMTSAREKHSGLPPPALRQHTSNCPPIGTCQPAGQDPSLQIAGPPWDETIAEHATKVTTVGSDPLVESMPKQHAKQLFEGLSAQLDIPASAPASGSFGKYPPSPHGK
jgi:hypothetical protein